MENKNIDNLSFKNIAKKSLLCVLTISILISMASFDNVGVKKENNVIANTRLVPVENVIESVKATETDIDNVIRENTNVDNFSQPISENKVAVAKKAVLVSLTADGIRKDIYTSKSTVGEFLNELKIHLSDEDEINYSTNTAIKDKMNIVIVRVDKIKKYHTEKLKFEEVTENNPNMAKGTKKVTQSGIEGEKQVCYEVVMKNGNIVTKNLLSEKVVKKPVNKIIEVGTKLPQKTIVRNGKTYKYKSVMTVTATAYDPSVGNITATGVRPRVGLIAVDPKVIPLGTKMFIESPDGSWSYGHAVAADTGGAIKGKKIDLFYNTSRECINFGVRKAKIYILE